MLVAIGNISAQNITSSDLSWTIKRTDYIGTGMFDEPGGTLISYGNTRIEWLDAAGALKRTFIIQETNGTWSNVATNGTVVYEVLSEGKACTITFLRDGSALRATLITLSDNEPPLVYEFIIQSLTTL